MKLFSIVPLLVMQGLIYFLTRWLFWQFAVQSPKARRWIVAGCFAFGNGLMLSALLSWSHTLFRFGALWLVFLLYVVFTGVIIGFCHHTLKLIFKQPARYTRVLRIVSPLILISFFAVSVYNAYTPVVRHAKITIGKPLAKPVRIGMAADLHLGILVGGRQLDKLADIMNREKVDTVNT